MIRNQLEEINCEKVAQYNNYSKKQMNRIFASHTEMTVGNYIYRKRLAQSVMDLRYTNIPIIEIAQKNGFETQESFTRALKKTFHSTPYKFRKENGDNQNVLDDLFVQVLEETSHENARSGSIDLPEVNVSFVHKPKTKWYCIIRNGDNLFPHDFYTQCKRDSMYEKLYQICMDNPVGGAYLTHIYKSQKFASLTLGFETKCIEMKMAYTDLEMVCMPESDYLVVNVPPYKRYELGAHVLAAWNVFSEFDYKSSHLERNLEEAPIYEWDSIEDGYTLYFPIKMEER